MAQDSEAWRPLPAWGPAELAASVPAGPLALLDGIMVEGRRCAVVAWAPVGSAATLADAVTLADTASLPEGAPAVLGAAIGSIAWDGTPRFWMPGSAALFDPGAGRLWTRGPLPPALGGVVPGTVAPTPPSVARPLWGKFRFCEAVRAAQERMAAGDVAKLILSVPFAAPCAHTPLTVYGRLTADSPPGLSFILDDGQGRSLVGVSPEPLVHLTRRRAELHLLAGTRRSDSGLDNDLLTADKDRVEHTVAVELARQDLRQVCIPSSVTIDAFMQLERHPGLVHLASALSGTLRADATPAELIRACFPAGTVGGVPRQAAISLIQQLEPIPREWYAGAVGAILPGGDVQLWLTIRTLQLQGGMAVVRTGAGLVRESDPEAEWQECCNKARPTMAAAGAEVVGA
ncbi:MAG: putative anthranilate synthase component [Firmicutes bacterium]|nr:putative anthranilate synthase component [Bacillota bacterium]